MSQPWMSCSLAIFPSGTATTFCGLSLNIRKQTEVSCLGCCRRLGFI